MSNATKNLIRRPYGKDGRDIHLPVDGGSTIYEGVLVAQLLATGMLVAGSTALSGPAVGVAVHGTDNAAGADAAKRCVVETDRIFEFANGTSTDACSEATPLFSPVYMGDDHTIFDNDNGGTLKQAGLFCGMSEDGKVRVYVGMLAGTAALTSILSGQGSLPISLYSFREVTAGGDVSNIAGNGGLLASDTTPILRGDAAESQEIAWAAGNADVIACQLTLPADFDDTADATLDLWVYTDNAGGGGIDAATVGVETSWNGGAVVSDTATDGTPAITAHKVTATIAAADIPADAAYVTIELTPAAHASDPVQLVAARLNYKRKLLTS